MLRGLIIIATLVGFASAVAFPRDLGFLTLSQDKITSIDPYSHYAAAVKCGPRALADWHCGLHCAATPNFQLYAAGGDGSKEQYWLVGYDKTLNSIIVAHEGTETHKLFADLTDLALLTTDLDRSLFPNIPDGIDVHNGFAEEQAKTAAEVLQSVRSLLQMHPGADVTVIGHSLGAALALLDGVLLRIQLDPTVNVKVIGYGMPRVGNDVFANFVDEILSGRVTRINNKKDPVPIVPARSFGYQHCSGEVHIQNSGEWIECPFQDNTDSRCTDGTVTSIFGSKFSEHSGPYNGIMLKCDY